MTKSKKVIRRGTDVASLGGDWVDPNCRITPRQILIARFLCRLQKQDPEVIASLAHEVAPHYPEGEIFAFYFRTAVEKGQLVLKPQLASQTTFRFQELEGERFKEIPLGDQPTPHVPTPEIRARAEAFLPVFQDWLSRHQLLGGDLPEEIRRWLVAKLARGSESPAVRGLKKKLGKPLEDFAWKSDTLLPDKEEHDDLVFPFHLSLRQPWVADRESWKEFEKAVRWEFEKSLLLFREEVSARLEESSVSRAPRAPHVDNLDWLVRYQVQGWTYAAIAAEASRTGPFLYPEAVKHAVSKVAAQIGLPLRRTGPGRPRKSR